MTNTPSNKNGPGASSAKTRTGTADQTLSKELIIVNSTQNSTVPAGYTAVHDVAYDKAGRAHELPLVAYWEASADLGDELALESYWSPEKGHFYTVDPLFEEYSLEDLRTIRDQLVQFIRRAEQLEGGAR